MLRDLDLLLAENWRIPQVTFIFIDLIIIEFFHWPQAIGDTGRFRVNVWVLQLE